MIKQDKITFLMHLVLSAQETLGLLEQALELEDEKRVEELKREFAKLNDEINRGIM